MIVDCWQIRENALNSKDCLFLPASRFTLSILYLLLKDSYLLILFFYFNFILTTHLTSFLTLPNNLKIPTAAPSNNCLLCDL